MPGGQFTNLKEQARAMGLEGRWHEVAKTYADVNMMFGDVIKVTPSSKIVGDMALSMVAAGLTCEGCPWIPAQEIAFPESVVGFFRGDIGQPPGGFPKALQKKVLKGKKALKKRAGETMKPADLKKLRKLAETEAGREITDEEFCSYLMYPKVFLGLRQESRGLWAGRRPADRDLFLRHENRAMRSLSTSSPARL